MFAKHKTGMSCAKAFQAGKAAFQAFFPLPLRRGFNIIDLILVLILIIAVLAVILVKTGKYSTSPQVARTKAVIEIDVLLKDKKISTKDAIFKPGEKSFITIRNVPYTKLDIVKSQKIPHQTVIPDPENPAKVIAVNDPSAPYTFNFLVTLKDETIITSDGAVVGGNKIKIGLPVLLEGYNYRLNGIVSDIRTL